MGSFFDFDHRIQITDFLRGLPGKALYGFSREGWNVDTDIRVFGSILYEIVVGHPAKDEVDLPADIPMFVSVMFKTGILAK
jgi:hypothetical protein